MYKKKPRTLQWFLVLAVLLHWWIFTRPLPEQLLNGPSSLASKPIEVERLKDLPIVQSNRADRMAENKKKPRFSAEFDQNTEQETRSPHSGKLHDGVAKPSQGGKRLGASPKSEERRTERGDDALLAEEGVPNLRELLDLSSTPNALPDDVKLGDRTLLNTETVSYASFFNRITDEIYTPWTDRIRTFLSEYELTGGKLASRVYVTKLAVTLNESGEVVSIQTLESCGIPGLDEAPKQAFWDRAPFPNPPEQMRGKDGEFRFPYVFQFEYKTSLFNLFPSAI